MLTRQWVQKLCVGEFRETQKYTVDFNPSSFSFGDKAKDTELLKGLRKRTRCLSMEEEESNFEY